MKTAFGMFLSAVTIACCAQAATIVCGGSGPGHLQGVACDGEAIYWCFTKRLVKTNLSGTELLSVDVPGHSGDICVHNGKVYIATDEGLYVREDNFKQEVRVYDAATLQRVAVYNIDADCAEKNVHVSSIEYANGRFYLAMGQDSSSTDEKNYVFEYNPSFELVAVHELATGNTQYGLQTIAFHDDKFYVGTYSGANVPASAFICDSEFKGFVPCSIPAAEGVMSVTGVLYTAVSSQNKSTGRWTATATSVDDLDRLYSVNGSSGDLVDTPEQLLTLGFLPTSRYYGGADGTISGSGTEQNNLIANAVPVNGNVFTLDHGSEAYAGGIAVASGTLTVPNPGAIDAPAHAAAEKAAPVVLSEGTLRFAAGGTLARDITLFPLAGYSKSAAIVDVASGAVTNTGVITSIDGHGNFIKTGAGTFVLATPGSGAVTNFIGSHGEHPTQWKNYITLPANGDGPSPTASHHPAFAVLNGRFAIATSPDVVTVLGNGAFIGGPTTPDGVETAGHLDIYSGIVRCDGFFTLGRDNGNSVNAPDGLSSTMNIHGGSFWCDTFDMSYYSFGADKTSTCRPVLNVYGGGTFETRDIFRIDYAGADATINVDGGRLTVGGGAFHSSYNAAGCRVTINISNGGEFICKSFMPVRKSSLEQPSYARVNVTSGGSITFRTVDSVDGDKGQDARFFFDGGTLKTNLDKAQGEIESYMPVDVGANGMTIDATVGSYWGLKVNSSIQSAQGVADGGLRVVNNADVAAKERWVCLNGGVTLAGGVAVSNAYLVVGSNINAAVTLEDENACIRPVADATISSIAYSGNTGCYDIGFSGDASTAGVRAYVVTANAFTPPKGIIYVSMWKKDSTTDVAPVGTFPFLRVPESSSLDASRFTMNSTTRWFEDSVADGWRTISVVISSSSRSLIDPRTSDDWLSGSDNAWTLGPWLLSVDGEKTSANFMNGSKTFNTAGGIDVSGSLTLTGGGYVYSGPFVKLGEGTLTIAGDNPYRFGLSLGGGSPKADGTNWELFDANGNATTNGYSVPVIVGGGTLVVGTGTDSPAIIYPNTSERPLWIGCPTTTNPVSEIDAAMVVNSGYVQVSGDFIVGRDRPASTASHIPLASSYTQNGGEVDVNKMLVGYSDSGANFTLQQTFNFTLNGGRFSARNEARVGTYYGSSGSLGNEARLTINGGLFEVGTSGTGPLYVGYNLSTNDTSVFEMNGGEVRLWAGLACRSDSGDDDHHAQIRLNGGTLMFGGSSKPSFTGNAKVDLHMNNVVLKPYRANRIESSSTFDGFAVREIGSDGVVFDLAEANIDNFDITTDFTGSGTITARGGNTNRSLRICYNLSSTGEFIAEKGGVIQIWHQDYSYFSHTKTVRVKDGGGVCSYYANPIKHLYLGENASDSTFVYGYGYGGENPLVADTTLQITGTVYCAFRRSGDNNPLRVPKKDSPLPILRGPKGSFDNVDVATQFKLHPLLAKDGVTATFTLDTSSTSYDQVTIAVSKTAYCASSRVVQVDNPGTTELDGSVTISGTVTPWAPAGVLSSNPTSGGGTIEVTGPLSGNGTIKLTTGRIEGRPEYFDGVTLDLNNASVRFTEDGTSSVNLKHLANDSTGMGVEVAEGKTVYVTGLLTNNSAFVKMDTGTLVLQNEALFTLAGNSQKNAMTAWSASSVPTNGDIYNINALTVNAGTLAFDTSGTVTMKNGASRFSGTSGEIGLEYTCDGPCVGSHPIPDGNGGALPAVMELWRGEIVNPNGPLCVGVYTSKNTYDNCSQFTTRPYAAFNLYGGTVRVKALAMGYAGYYQCGKYELNIHDGLFEIGDGHAIVGCEGSDVRINGEDNECVVNVYGGELRKLAGSRFLLGSKLTGWKTYVPMMKLNVYGGIVRADESIQLEVPGGNGCKGFLGLYGGVFEVGNVTNRSSNARTAGYVHFDGGTLRPLMNNASLSRFTSVTVGAGGGTIDVTNSNTYTLGQLARASDLGAAADGGFGASGTGTLIINVANGFTGPTRVSGTATLKQGKANAFSDTLVMDGGTVDLNGIATTFRSITGHGTIIGNCTVTETLELDGELNVNGNLTVGNNVAIYMALNDDGTAATPLNVSGALTGGSGITIDFGRYYDTAFRNVQAQIGSVGEGSSFSASPVHIGLKRTVSRVTCAGGALAVAVQPFGGVLIVF